MKILVAVLQVAGVLVISAGVALVYVPAGIIACGIGIALFGIALERAAIATVPEPPPRPPQF